VDAGRLEGIKRLKASPYNLLGRFSDDRSGAAATGTKYVELQHRNFGEFRVPGLRNVALTAPYMHDGSLATLDDVIEFYSKGGRPNPNLDEKIRPLDLTANEKLALAAFLRTLTGRTHEGLQ
jgi:cytochrome c peroxidase